MADRQAASISIGVVTIGVNPVTKDTLQSCCRCSHASRAMRLDLSGGHKNNDVGKVPIKSRPRFAS